MAAIMALGWIIKYIAHVMGRRDTGGRQYNDHTGGPYRPSPPVTGPGSISNTSVRINRILGIGDKYLFQPHMQLKTKHCLSVSFLSMMKSKISKVKLKS